MYSHAIGQQKDDRKELLEIQMSLEELRKEMEEDWNLGRDNMSPVKERDNNASTSNFVKAAQNEVLGDENSKVGMSPEPGDKRPIDADDCVTPFHPRKKMKFARVTPKSELLTKFNCHLCPKTYSSLKALKKHLKENHERAIVPEGLKEISDKVTCRMCGSKQSRDMITRHLRDVHKVEKAEKSSVFRGFLTLDEVHWEPLWLLQHQDDPPTEVVVPVDEEGKVTLYGVKFKVDELVEKSDDKTGESLKSKSTEATFDANDGEKDENLELHDDATKTVGERSFPGIKEMLMIDNETELERGKGLEDNSKENLVKEFDDKTAEDLENEYNEETIEEGSSPVIEQGTVTGSKIEDLANLEEALEEVDFMPVGGFRSISKKNSERAIARCLSDSIHYENFESNDDDMEQDEATRTPNNKIEVKVFTEEIADGEFWSATMEESDSDFDYSDNEDFTELRLHMKQLRIQRRNTSELQSKLCDLEKNSIVIRDFENFLKIQKLDKTTDISNLSSIRKAMGHLFLYPDSLLQYKTDTIADYNLERHLNPLSEDFLEVSDPTAVDGWIQTNAGDSGKLNPGRRREQLKSHARFRDYIHEKLTKTSFGSSADSYYKKEIVLKRLEQIASKISKKKIFQQLNKLETEERLQKQKARSVVYPSNNYNEQRAVVNWFESEKAKLEEKDCLQIYNKCIAGKEIKYKEFLRFGNWTRFTLCLEDRNRRSVYQFSNTEFQERVAKWLPPTKKEENSVDVDKFELLPETWNPDVPHPEGAPPSCWVIDVSGERGLKGGKHANIVLTPRSAELCLKFQDLKRECLEEVDDNDPFFVNLKGKPLTAIQRTKGSLLEKMGEVCGVDNPTVNTFRRAAEVKVQASPLMKASVENLQSHSRQVGLKHYDRSGPSTRASFINQLSEMESPQKADIEVPEDVKRKRLEKEKDEREKILRQAQQTLIQDKLRKKETKSRKCRLNNEEREFLQKTFSSLDGQCLTTETFPGIYLYSNFCILIVLII